MQDFIQNFLSVRAVLKIVGHIVFALLLSRNDMFFAIGAQQFTIYRVYIKKRDGIKHRTRGCREIGFVHNISLHLQSSAIYIAEIQRFPDTPSEIPWNQEKLSETGFWKWL